jgi:hypothetical protein
MPQGTRKGVPTHSPLARTAALSHQAGGSGRVVENLKGQENKPPENTVPWAPRSLLLSPALLFRLLP